MESTSFRVAVRCRLTQKREAATCVGHASRSCAAYRRVR